MNKNIKTCDSCGALVAKNTPICLHCSGDPHWRQELEDRQIAGDFIKQVQTRNKELFAQMDAQKREKEAIEKKNKKITSEDNLFSKLLKSGFKGKALRLLNEFYDCHYYEADYYLEGLEYKYSEGDYDFEDFYFSTDFLDDEELKEGKKKEKRLQVLAEKSRETVTGFETEIEAFLKTKQAAISERKKKAEQYRVRIPELFQNATLEIEKQNKKWLFKDYKVAKETLSESRALISEIYHIEKIWETALEEKYEMLYSLMKK